MELAGTAHAPLRAAAPAPPACAAARPLCASACAPHSCREGSPGRRDFLMRSHQKAKTRQGRTGGSAGGRATHYCRFFSFFSCDLVIGCWPSCCWSSAAASCPPAASSASCKSGWQPHACCVQLHVICNVFTSHLIRQTIAAPAPGLAAAVAAPAPVRCRSFCACTDQVGVNEYAADTMRSAVAALANSTATSTALAMKSAQQVLAWSTHAVDYITAWRMHVDRGWSKEAGLRTRIGERASAAYCMGAHL